MQGDSRRGSEVVISVGRLNASQGGLEADAAKADGGAGHVTGLWRHVTVLPVSGSVSDGSEDRGEGD